MKKIVTIGLSKLLILLFLASILSLSGLQCKNDEEDDNDEMTNLLLLLNSRSIYTISIPKGVSSQ